MKTFLFQFSIALLLYGCNTAQKESSIVTNIDDTPPRVEFVKNNEILEICEEYFLAGSEIDKSALLRTSYYSSRNRISAEYHHSNSSWTREGKKILYDYLDSLLVQKRVFDHNGDSIKVIYSYDKQGLKIKEEHYSFKRRVESELEKGLGGAGGCIVTDNDLEVYPSWKKRSEISFNYDSLGRKIEYYAPNIHWDSQNRYIWSYNEKGKLLQYRSYDHNKLIWIYEFSYFDGGYKKVRTWFDDDGIAAHLKNSHRYIPQLTFVHWLNDNQQVIFEEVYDEHGQLRSQETTKHDDRDRVIETKKFNSEKELVSSHLFKYQIAKK